MRVAFIESIEPVLPVIAFDEAIAKRHGELTGKLQLMGLQLGVADLIIAATALERGWSVLTLDGRSYPRVPGLQCELLTP